MRSRFSIIIILCIMVSLLVGCQATKVERQAGKMVGNIVDLETQLNNFDIRYNDYLEGTKGYFHEYATYIMDTDVIFSYPGQDGQQIAYTVGDTDSFTDDDLLGLKQIRDELMNETTDMTVDTYISQGITLDDTILVFVKLVPVSYGEAYARYHMFRFREYDEELMVSSVDQFQVLEQVEQVIDLTELDFDLLK